MSFNILIYRSNFNMGSHDNDHENTIPLVVVSTPLVGRGLEGNQMGNTDFIRGRGVRRLLLPPSLRPSLTMNLISYFAPSCQAVVKHFGEEGGSGERKPKPIAIFRVCAEDTPIV